MRSSREHAPWALLDFGIRCIIAPSFGEIFFNNSVRNGLLPVVLPWAACDALSFAASGGENARIHVDLERQEVLGPDGETYAFSINPLRRQRLLAGLDDIAQTLTCLLEIERFEAARRTGDYAWLPSLHDRINPTPEPDSPRLRP